MPGSHAAELSGFARLKAVPHTRNPLALRAEAPVSREVHSALARPFPREAHSVLATRQPLNQRFKSSGSISAVRATPPSLWLDSPSMPMRL